MKLYKIKIIKKSSFYETPSYPDIKNPKFINIVVEVSTYLSPEDLVSVLIFVEEKLERKRIKKNDLEHVILILLITMEKLWTLLIKT